MIRRLSVTKSMTNRPSPCLPLCAAHHSHLSQAHLSGAHLSGAHLYGDRPSRPAMESGSFKPTCRSGGLAVPSRVVLLRRVAAVFFSTAAALNARVLSKTSHYAASGKVVFCLLQIALFTLVQPAS